MAVLAFVIAATDVLGTLGQWLASSILLVSVPPLLSPLRRPASHLLARLHAHPARLPIALCTVVFVWLFGELLLGHPPASRDHGIHFFQTAALVRDLVPYGYLHGWSPALNNGIAIGEHYPILGYLWTGAAYLLTGGAVGLRASYAIGLFAVWATAASGVFLLAHTLLMEIGRGRSKANVTANPKNVTRAAAWAGCIAATLWLLDEGYSREGGWHYLMFHGVWPQLLSTALWTLSLPAALKAMRGPSVRRLAWAGLCLAGSILAHPFGLLTGATSMGLLPLAVWLTGKNRPMPARTWGVWLLILAMVGALTAGWLVVFFDHASTLGRTPVPWETWSSLSSSLLTGELFHDQRAWVGPLAVVGLVAGILRVAPMTWWIVGTTVALLLLGSQAAITVLRLDLVLSSFKNLQFIRYAIALKPLWYALAGTGAVVAATAARPLWRHLKRQLRTDEHRLQARHRIALALLAGPLVWGGLHGISRVVARPVGGLHTLERSHHGADEAQLLAILRGEQQARDTPMRVAFLRQSMGGGLYPMFPLTDLDVPIVLDGHVPTVNSIYKIEHRRLPVVRALGVTHIVRDRPLPDSEKPLAEALTPVATAGPYTVERVTDPEKPTQARPGSFVWSAGSGTVSVQSARAQAWSWQLSGFDEDVHTIDSVWAPHPRFHWQFTPDNGQPAQSLDFKPARLAQGGLTGMRLDVRGNGVLTLTLAHPAPHQWAAWISGIVFVLTLIGLFFPRPWDVPTRLHSPRARRLLAWGWVAVLLLAALWIARRQHTLLARTWESEQAFTHPGKFVRDLVDARAYTVTRSPNTTCDGMLGRDSRRGCSEDDQATQVGMLYRQPYLYRCVQVTVPARGRAEIEFVNLGHARVRGIVARDTGTGGRGTKIKWRSGGKNRFTNLGIKKHLFEAPAKSGRFVVEIENESFRDQKVCAAAAEVAPATAEPPLPSPLP